MHALAAALQFWARWSLGVYSTYLHSQVSDDGTLVPLQSLQGNVGNLPLGLPQEHLTGCSQHLLILALDLHLQGQTRNEKFSPLYLVRKECEAEFVLLRF